MTVPAAPIPKRLPWRFLVVGDFSPSSDPQGPRAIEEKTLKTLFEEFKPTIRFSMPAEESGPNCIEQKHCFQSMKEFQPDVLALQLPITKALLQLRIMLEKLRSGDLQPESVHQAMHDHSLPDHTRSAIQKIITPPPSQNDRDPQRQPSESEQSGMLDSISSMLDLGAPQSLSKPESRRSPSIERITEALELLDDQIQRRLETILSDRELIYLEESWRGLKLIADNTDMRSGMSLEVAACDREQLVSFLRDEIYAKAWQDNIPPVDMIVLLHPFSRSPVDIADLSELSRMSQAIQVPLVAWAGSSFFGAERWQQVDTLMPSFQTAMSGAGYEKFRAFREKPEAQWLAITTNALFGRQEYGSAAQLFRAILRSSGQTTGNSVGSSSGSSNQSTIPYVSASAAAVSTVIGTLNRIGKEDYADNKTRELPNLVQGKNGTAGACIWNGDKLWELADAGLLPLSGGKSITGIRLGSINTCAQDGGSLIQVLISGHLSRQVLAIIHSFGALESQELAAVIAAGLKNFFGIRYENTDDTLVNVTISDGNGKHHFHIRCESPITVLGERISFELQFEL